VSGVDPGMPRRGEPPGRRCYRGMGCRLTPFENMSCLVPLRTGMSREPDHRTLLTHHSSLNGQGTNDRLARVMPLLPRMQVIV
jgi:hypothetical protein